MATAARPYADELVTRGFPADTMVKLEASINALNDAIEERGHLRHVRAGATKSIREQIILGREAVRVLDAVISGQFARDAIFLAAWASASRVDLSGGNSRATATSAAASTPST